LHIQEGVIQAVPVLATGAALTAAGSAAGLFRTNHQKMPRVGLMAAVFFVTSLLHVPVGPASTHLIMNGLAGLILGWAAFPAILVGLVLQALLFQYGGFTVLGVNTFNMAAPAVLCGLIVRPLLRRGILTAWVAGAAAGAGAVLLAALLTSGTLIWAGKEFLTSAGALLAAHLPVMIIEAIVCGSCVAYLARVKPTVLGLEARVVDESS
jgi:cobalt/nickel transport system permease protein